MPIRLFASVRKRLLLPLTAAFVLLFVALLVGHHLVLEENRAQAAGRALDFARSFAAGYESQIDEAQALLRHLATLPQADGSHPAQCESLLAGLARTHPQLMNLAVLDKTGGIRCAGQTPSPSFKPGETRAVRQAIASGKAVVGTLARDPAQGGPVLVLAQPVAGDAAVVRLIVAYLDLSRINRQFAALVPPGSVLRILDRDGTFLVRQPNPECCLGRSGLNLVGIREALADSMPQVTESVWLDKVVRLQADVPLKHAAGGVVSIGIPLGLVQAPANRALAAGTLILLLLSIVMYAVAWIGSTRYLLRPIGSLANAAHRMREGELDCRIPPGPGNDEISTLIEDFNAMAGSLGGQRRALIESERRFRELYEQAPLAYQSLDAAGLILDVNDAWLDLFHRRKDAVIGCFVGDFLTKDSLTALGERFASFERDNHKGGNVFEIVRGDGERRLVEVNGRVSRDAAGEFLCAHCILTDITARIEQERQLRLAASVFAHANEAITITDADSSIVTVSPRFTEITGYSPEEVIGRNPRILQSGRQDAAFYRAMWAALASDKGHWSGEIWNKRKDGSIYPEWLSITAVRDDAGKVINYVAIFTDLSERVAAEQAIRDSEQRYRTMFESAPEGVWIIGADERTIEVNQRLSDLLGYSREEMLGKEPTDFTDADNSRIFEAQKNRRATTTRRNYEIALRHRDGHNIPVSFSANNLYREDGSLLAVLAFVSDITERKAHEQERQRLHEELEQRVIERTRALLTANRELGAFSYSVSHDLRAPLRAINGFSHALEEEYGRLLDDNGRHYLARVRAGSERMAELIDHLLELSQLSRREMNIAPTDLSFIAGEIAAELHAEEPARRVEWIIAPDVCARSDAVLLRVVLLNLLGNAWKYTSRRGEARIEFGTAEHAGRRTYFVSDNGAGFDMAHVGKLFGAFQRLHSPAEFPGSGIGLATVARVIHRHGGEVWAEGRPETGATFYFTLA
ncbi:MAG: PAS domain S-box protein [Rhodocyclales bacterium]|nr:PAS domain S-box protein [Rhodocyclales bacterium]